MKTGEKASGKQEIDEERVARYYELSSRALQVARTHVARGKEKEAHVIVEIVSCYLQDAKHFWQDGKLADAFACLNYAHGWLDCGARLGIFDVKDNKLFTVDPE